MNTPSRRRPWSKTLVTIAVTVTAGTAAIIVLGFYAVVSHLDLANANPEAAQKSFEQTRDRFLGSEPLVRVTLENGDLRGEVIRRTLPSKIRPDTLHLMTWDSDDERIVRVQIPLWLGRILDDGSMGDLVGDLDLSVEDIDHHGPGLILDHQDARQLRVLLWAE